MKDDTEAAVKILQIGSLYDIRSIVHRQLEQEGNRKRKEATGRLVPMFTRRILEGDQAHAAEMEKAKKEGMSDPKCRHSDHWGKK